MIEVTHHAAMRFTELVDPSLTIDQARRAIMTHEPAIRCAAENGCHCVRIGCGAKLIIENWRVVTVCTRKWTLPPLIARDAGVAA
ncbi:MAG: hypothetical protein CMN72_07880 [Sphingomonas sp.]|nr:hypothetical protein [Sphingomonas sp.]